MNFKILPISKNSIMYEPLSFGLSYFLSNFNTDELSSDEYNFISYYFERKSLVKNKEYIKLYSFELLVSSLYNRYKNICDSVRDYYYSKSALNFDTHSIIFLSIIIHHCFDTFTYFLEFKNKSFSALKNNFGN